MLIGSNGNVIRAEPCRNPKVRPVCGGSHVYADFRRDSLRRFGKIGIAGLERHYRAKTPAPSKSIRIYTDVLRAVRMAKHIREGYRNEISQIARVRDSLELAVKGTSSDSLFEAISLIDDAYHILPKRSLHKILARAKMISALNELLCAASMQEGSFEYFKHRNPAISLIHASIARLQRREEAVLCLAQYAEERENYLRFLRDTYVHGRLESLAGALWGNGAYAVINAYIDDYDTHQRLQELSVLCDDVHSAEFLKGLIEIGQRASSRKGKWRLVEHLRNAYRNFIKKDYTRTGESLNEAMVFLAINKPFYFAQQLELTADAYTRDVELLMQDAHMCLLSANLLKARECLTDAAALTGIRLK
ncbi:MAG: hypothetical protein N3H30_03005 [Candidatus Micrarchaeota archaeon]|nr:hypothetical protein [Candidatus Micrarchaeota archaeon]